MILYLYHLWIFIAPWMQKYQSKLCFCSLFNQPWDRYWTTELGTTIYWYKPSSTCLLANPQLFGWWKIQSSVGFFKSTSTLKGGLKFPCLVPPKKHQLFFFNHWKKNTTFTTYFTGEIRWNHPKSTKILWNIAGDSSMGWAGRCSKIWGLKCGIPVVTMG
jgi:hypothetical protein